LAGPGGLPAQPQSAGLAQKTAQVAWRGLSHGDVCAVQYRCAAALLGPRRGARGAVGNNAIWE
jgi:hypothetical protein